MKLADISSHDPFVPVQDDPMIPRNFKRVPVYDSLGRIVSYTQATFDANVFPSSDAVDLGHNDDLTDPGTYASVVTANDGVDLITSPNVSAMEAVDIANNYLNS